MDSTSRKLLMGLLAVILAVAVGSAGFMLGYAATCRQCAGAHAGNDVFAAAAGQRYAGATRY
jgi:hypothetical protein